MDKQELDDLLDRIEDTVPDINVYSSNEDKQKVLDDINTVLRAEPLNADVLMWKGFYYEALEEYDTAIEVYETVLSIQPDNNLAQESIKNCNDYKEWKLEDNIKRENIANYTGSYKSSSYDKNDTINFKWLNVYHIVALKIIVLAIFIYAFFQPIIFGFTDMQLPRSYKLRMGEYNLQELTINPLSDYNGKSKKDVLDIRKKYVQSSLFSTPGYKPDENTFGQIQDGKAWWGVTQIVCSSYNNPKFDRTSGFSAVSKHMNNPNILVGTVFPFNFYKEYDSIGYCTAQYSKTIPKKMEYLKEKNLIIATYDMDRRILKSYLNWNGRRRHYFLNLTGLNAKDLGYKYGYAIDLKNIEMTEQTNISNNIHQFRDFVHVGASCKVPGGCNNISPHQTELDYRITGFPAEMTIKLWKQKPINQYMKADVYYRIIFEKL